MSAPEPAVTTAALVRLTEALERAQVAARGQHVPLPPGHTSARFAQALAAKAFQQFLADAGLGRFTDLPLALLQALADLDRGNAVPPLDPAPLRTRPPPPIAVARTMTRAVKALDLLLAQTSHPGIKQAAQQVWQARPSWDGLFSSAEAMISFRKKVRSGRAPADVRRLWKMPLPKEAGETQAEQAAWLLAMLAEG
jgi:hypothetical protein